MNSRALRTPVPGWLLRAVLPLLILSGMLAHLTAPHPVRAALPSARLLANLPLSFLENGGQLDPQVRYSLHGRDASVYFTRDGLTFSLARSARARLSMGQPVPGRQEPATRYAVKLDFVGANPEVRPVGQERTATTVSYFQGSRSHWRAGLKSYASLVYRDLWPGIDLRYSGAQNRIKYEFVVHPGADPDRIRLAYRGASSLQVNADGELHIETPTGGFHDARPYAYQESGEGRHEVPSAYVVEPVSARASRPYHFRLGTYDPSKTLILDPTVILYAGYVGGASADEVDAVAVDGAGNAYLAGTTSSDQGTFPNGTGFASLPGTPGPDQTYNGGSRDAFVAKVKADGSGLVYVGYIGGSDMETATGIAVDGAGAAYLVGYTSSTESTFPVRGGPDLTYNGNSQFGGGDAFIAKVRPDGTALEYCGYIGGSAGDQAAGVAVDTQGSAYVTGQTQSSEATFPVRVGPDLTYNGSADAFVAKVQPDGAALVYCGYIGGSGGELGAGIAVDITGSAYVAGTTTSRESTFPVVGGPDLSFNDVGAEVGDAFVAMIRSLPSSADPRNNLEYCGYLGGETVDQARGIGIDRQGNAYITGLTGSPQSSFPVKTGPALVYKDQGDAFVAAIRAVPTDPNVFNNLIYCGYIGGDKQDAANAIAVDEGGAVYIAGDTFSDQTTFPVKDGPRLSRNGPLFADEAFLAKVQPGGGAIEYAGYIGGSQSDTASSIAVDRTGSAYVGGTTASTGSSNPFDFTVLTGPDVSFNGQSDGFIAKVGPTGPVGNRPPSFTTCPAPVNTNTSSGRGASVTLTAVVTDPDRGALTMTWNVDGGPVEKTDTVPAGGPPTTASLSFTQTYTMGAHTVVISVSDGAAPAVTCSTTVTVSPAAADTVPPTLSSCFVGTRTLPGAGGAVALSVIATDNVAVTSVVATMTLGGAPTTVPLHRDTRSNRYLGTFTAPANTTHNAQTYAVSFTAADGAGNQRSLVCGSVTVAGIDDIPPVVSSCTITPRQRDALGGSISLKLQVSDNVAVASVTAAATLDGVATPISVTAGKLHAYVGSLTLPQNRSTIARIYKISVTAADSSGNKVTAACGEVTVAGDTEGPSIGFTKCRLYRVTPTRIYFVETRVTDISGVLRVLAVFKPTAGGAEESSAVTRAPGSNLTYRDFNVPSPVNRTLTAQTYHIYLRATDLLGNVREQLCGTTTVPGAATETVPPRITDCSVTPSQLPAAGGDVAFVVTATDNAIVATVRVTLNRNGVPTTVPLAPTDITRFVGGFTLPPNNTAQPQVYAVTVTATDASGNHTTSSCGDVTVAASAGLAPAARGRASRSSNAPTGRG